METTDAFVHVTIKEFGDFFQTCAKGGVIKTREVKGSRDEMAT